MPRREREYVGLGGWLLLLVVAGCADRMSGVAPTQEPAPKEFYQTLDTPPAPQLTPQQALAEFVIAPGFHIALAASEPLLEDPVAVDWDEDGHLYVAEMRAYMTDVEGSNEQAPIGEVVRLRDNDGDGVFDEREALLGGLVLPRAVRIVNEGLLVAEMGRLWLCPSTSGWSRDIDCAAKRLLGVYGEHQGSVEHAENGLLVGLDNWLYSAKSSRRLKLQGGQLLEQPTLFRGQWGIAQDDVGRLFYNTNSNLLLGDYFSAQALVTAGQRTPPGLGERISPNEEVFAVRVNPGVNRAYVPGVLRADGRLRAATSASGMAIYRGGKFAPDDPNAFVAEPAANVVAALRLVEEGVAVTAERRLYADAQWGQRDFLASTDERFRPVDVQNGPDGALYVVDFYRGIIQDHIYLSPQLKAQVLERGLDRPLGMGRLWRISKQADYAPQPLPDWPALDTVALVALLDAPDAWRRATAQRLLIRSTADDVRVRLAQLLMTGQPLAATHALWTLEGRGNLTAEMVVGALQRSVPLAEAALLAGGEQLDAATLTTALQRFAVGSRAYLYTLAAMRQYAAQAPTVARLGEVVLAAGADRYVRAFVQAAVRGSELLLMQQLLQSDEWTAAREQATPMLMPLALQMFVGEGAAVEPLLDFIVGLPDDQAWAQRAMLAGLYEATRVPGFERAVLAGAHDVFAPSDGDLWSMASKARQGFTWPGDTLPADAKPLTSSQAANRALGATFYDSSCANCHGQDGRGVGQMGPPLANSPWVTEAPERLARIVLHGLQGPIEVAGQEWNAAMPGHQHFAGFDDRVASGLLTFLRRSWGHAGYAIDPDLVAQVRQETGDRQTQWTAVELEDIAIETHYARYAGQYGRPDMPISFRYDGRQLQVASGIFNGPLTALKEDYFLFEPRQLKFEFVLADDAVVSAVVMHTGDASITMPRVGD